MTTKRSFHKVTDQKLAVWSGRKTFSESRDCIHCAGYRDPRTRVFHCGYGTSIGCEECKYGIGDGKKDPQAKVNQPAKSSSR